MNEFSRFFGLDLFLFSLGCWYRTCWRFHFAAWIFRHDHTWFCNRIANKSILDHILQRKKNTINFYLHFIVSEYSLAKRKKALINIYNQKSFKVVFPIIFSSFSVAIEKLITEINQPWFRSTRIEWNFSFIRLVYSLCICKIYTE